MGTCGVAGFAPEVNGKCLGASEPELLEKWRAWELCKSAILLLCERLVSMYKKRDNEK
jgi:hypothetical protein